MPYNKKFSKSLKDRYDKLGKTYAIEIMKDVFSAKIIAENIKEDKGDMSDGIWDQEYCLESGQKVKVDPEIKVDKGGYWGEQHASMGRPFKYPDVDIPYRKINCIADIHIVISDNGDYGFVVTKAAMLEHLETHAPKIKSTIYEPDGGWFFGTPVEMGFFVVKKNGFWERWEE